MIPWGIEATVDIYEYKSPLVTIKEGIGKISNGYYKIIHAIDLDDYERILNDIKPIIRYQTSRTSPLASQLDYQVSQIDNLLDQLRARNVKKNKRSINWIGSAWKWLAGNPDATDWDKIVTTSNDLTGNSNKQYTINNYLIKTTNKILDNYNRILDEIDANDTVRFEQSLYNKLGLVKYEISQIVLATQLAKKV